MGKLYTHVDDTERRLVKNMLAAGICFLVCYTIVSVVFVFVFLLRCLCFACGFRLAFALLRFALQCVLPCFALRSILMWAGT